MEQRDAEKEIVVENVLVPGELRRVQLAFERLADRAAIRPQQLVLREKQDQFLDLLALRRELRLAHYVLTQRLERPVLAPARQQFEFEPADFEERIAHRIL